MLRRTNTSNLIYHYTSAATALEHILYDMSLQLGPLQDTNDPAEEGLPSPIVGDGADADLFADLFFEVQSRMAGRKLACFSRDRPNSVYEYCWHLSFQGYARDRMWAQYADNHRGVCLFFDRARLESAFREQLGNDGIALTGDVSYRDEVPLHALPWDKEDHAQLGQAEWLKRRCEQVARSRSFAKRTDWESEQEYRIVFLRTQSKGHPPRETIFIRGALLAICVGHHFPKGLLPCIKEVCDRESINAYQIEFAGDFSVQQLYPPGRRDPPSLAASSATTK